MIGYDVWRCWDRFLSVSSFKEHPQATLYLSPAAVVRAFGDPSFSNNKDSSGMYTFEDTSLDLFVMTEVGATILSQGLNRPEEYYEKQ